MVPALRTIARLWLAEDYVALVELAAKCNCLPRRFEATRPDEYDLVGDHYEDAHYRYPLREALLRNLIKAALGDPGESV
jgi:hypothetical protein